MFRQIMVYAHNRSLGSERYKLLINAIISTNFQVSSLTKKLDKNGARYI